jgi:hypothetical protein
MEGMSFTDRYLDRLANKPVFTNRIRNGKIVSMIPDANCTEWAFKWRKIGRLIRLRESRHD